MPIEAPGLPVSYLLKRLLIFVLVGFQQWADQKRAALFATASRSTSLLLLSRARLLLRGLSVRETIRRSGDCKRARGLLPPPTSFRYSSVNPRYGPDQLLGGTAR